MIAMKTTANSHSIQQVFGINLPYSFFQMWKTGATDKFFRGFTMPVSVVGAIVPILAFQVLDVQESILGRLPCPQKRIV